MDNDEKYGFRLGRGNLLRSASVLMDKRETQNARESPVARIAAPEEGGGVIKSLINSIFMRSLPLNGNVIRGQGMNK